MFEINSIDDVDKCNFIALFRVELCGEWHTRIYELCLICQWFACGGLSSTNVFHLVPKFEYVSDNPIVNLFDQKTFDQHL